MKFCAKLLARLVYAEMSANRQKQTRMCRSQTGIHNGLPEKLDRYPSVEVELWYRREQEAK